MESIDFRPLEASDAAGLWDLFFRLSPQTVYLRFFQPVRNPSRTYLQHLATVDHHDREAIAAVHGDHIIGVARYDRYPEDPDKAEIAIVIEDAWQGHGVGKVLLERLRDRAAEEGIHQFVANVLGENRRMLALAKELSPDRRAHIESGEWVVEIPIDATPTAA